MLRQCDEEHYPRSRAQNAGGWLATLTFNRRFYPFNAFRSLLGIAGGAEAPTRAALYSGEWKHPHI
jgi:hypothetical protein